MDHLIRVAAPSTATAAGSCGKVRTRCVTVRLKAEVVVRRMGKALGGILGLTLKGVA